MSLLPYIFLFFLFLIFLGALFGTAWIPTRKKDFETIAELGDVKPGQIFYDLGSGTGELLFYLSNKYKVNCIGIEISPILYLYSKFKSLFHKNVKILYGNYYNYNLSNADAVYIFLLPSNYYKLKEKFKNELQDDARIIVSSWSMNNSPLKTIKKKGSPIYFLYSKRSILQP